MVSTERRKATTEYTAEELAQLALDSPERFSPNVTLRAVVQDYLLPTIAYYGGAAEIAYFAQTAEAYQRVGPTGDANPAACQFDDD